jgi:hypothetical protein
MSSRRRPAPRILWICPPRLMGQPVTYPSQDFSDRIHGISLPRFLSIVHADVTSLSDTMLKYGWADGKLCNQLRRRPSPPRNCSCIHDLTLASMPLCSLCWLSIVGVYDESTKIAVGVWFRLQTTCHSHLLILPSLFYKKYNDQDLWWWMVTRAKRS